ncbi:fst3 transcription factor [Salix suchowensis]|nr:fst3 transcription factor [Salix suchowensis]
MTITYPNTIKNGRSDSRRVLTQLTRAAPSDASFCPCKSKCQHVLALLSHLPQPCRVLTPRHVLIRIPTSLRAWNRARTVDTDIELALIAIDDRHTPKLYARFLAGLLSRHRRDGATVGRLQTQPPPTQNVSTHSDFSSITMSQAGTSSFAVSPQGSAGEPPSGGFSVTTFSQSPTSEKISTPIYRPEATFSPGSGPIQFGSDFDMLMFGTENGVSEEEMLATMQALKNPVWWQTMMMPGGAPYVHRERWQQALPVPAQSLTTMPSPHSSPGLPSPISSEESVSSSLWDDASLLPPSSSPDLDAECQWEMRLKHENIHVVKHVASDNCSYPLEVSNNASESNVLPQDDPGLKQHVILHRNFSLYALKHGQDDCQDDSDLSTPIFAPGSPYYSPLNSPTLGQLRKHSSESSDSAKNGKRDRPNDVTNCRDIPKKLKVSSSCDISFAHRPASFRRSLSLGSSCLQNGFTARDSQVLQAPAKDVPEIESKRAPYQRSRRLASMLYRHFTDTIRLGAKASTDAYITRPFSRNLRDQLIYSPETRFHAGYLFLRYFFLVEVEAEPANIPESQGVSTTIFYLPAFSIDLHRDTLWPLHPIMSTEYERLAPHEMSFDDLEVLDFTGGWTYARKLTWECLYEALLRMLSTALFRDNCQNCRIEPDVLRYRLSLLTVAALIEALISTLELRYEFVEGWKGETCRSGKNKKKMHATHMQKIICARREKVVRMLEG